ncbi:MAG: mechanosensitive ion channel [Hyphomicrobiaceae bacterium]|nr:mechanosensitive ion channel [Hyphomicrobiaceae bacterium]
MTELTGTALTLIKGLASTWTLVQIGVVLLCYVAARVVSNALTPALEERVRRIESQPQLLRVLVIPLRRLTWILFALSLWLAAYVLREVTWPSRSYYIGIAATIVIVGVVISLISRFIRNRSLATPFFYAAWAVAALHIVGLLDETLAALDAIAFSIGSFRLSLLAVIKAVLLLTVLAWVATIVGNFVERRLRQNEDIAPALQVLIAKFVKFTLLTIAVLATISAVGIDLTALTIFSGALGLGIGFGLQKVASNLISGIIILSDRSIKPGDVISLGDTFGWINSLKSRYVSVITRDGVEYLIPNESFVSEQVVNWSYSTRNVRLEIKFGVSYEADPHVVRKLATDAVTQIERVIERPAPVCHVVGFGDSSVDFVLRFWIRDPKNGLTNVRGQAFLALWDAFKANGIDIPYPHRQLIFPKDAGEPAPKATPKRTTRRGRKRKTVA